MVHLERLTVVFAEVCWFLALLLWKNLMLKDDVVEAVRKKKFHIYAVETLDEGLEVLTGMKAGKKLTGGAFEDDSIHARVNRTLTEYARRWKEMSSGR